MTNNNLIPNEPELTMDIVNCITNDQVARRKITCESHYWFFHIYFSDYVKYPTADYQREMFAISEDISIKTAIIVAFRGSAKSTIMTMSYPIWAVLGKLQKKCVVILSQTQQQAKSHLTNIKRELESNELLRSDLGPFQEESDEWGSFSLVIPKFNARIIAASSEQSIRGIRHGANRPDLMICDDVEDTNSTKTQEGRDKTFNWFNGEIVPCGDKNTKYVIVGNLLHEDSLLMRLKDLIDDNKINAIFKAYPLINTEQKILWPGKFSSLEEIDEFKKSVGDEKAWQREFMLKIIADQDQIIRREWIQYYDQLPVSDRFTDEHKSYMYTACGVDLAISKNATADYTAIVTGKVYGCLENLRVYILPPVINERMNFPETLERIKNIAINVLGKHWENVVVIEDVAYQKALIQTLENMNIKAEGLSPGGQDKRARLSLTSHLIASGKVLFPRTGAETLINQLVYFGVEKHDDLSDALTILLTHVNENDRPPVQVLKNVYGF